MVVHGLLRLEARHRDTAMNRTEQPFLNIQEKRDSDEEFGNIDAFA